MISASSLIMSRRPPELGGGPLVAVVSWNQVGRTGFDPCYGNLPPCGNTLWVRVKRHAIHHLGTWFYVQKIRGRLLQEFIASCVRGRLVENTLLIAEGILYVTNLYHNILLVFGLIIF